MGHLHTDMTVRGSKADVELKNVLIDTGATYTVLPRRFWKEWVLGDLWEKLK